MDLEIYLFYRFLQVFIYWWVVGGGEIIDGEIVQVFDLGVSFLARDRL